jgi:multidrug resistance efflux pump
LTSARTQARRLEAGATEGTPYRVALAQKDVEAAQEGVRQAQQGVRTAQEAKTQILAVADRDIDAANAALQQAQAGATAAREAGDSMRLTSPMAGIATGVTARVGETAQPGMPLLTVVSLNGLHVEAMVTARQLPGLRLAQRARVTADSAPGRTFEAEVSAIARAAEPDGRSFKVQFRFRAAPTALRPGQSVQITLS